MRLKDPLQGVKMSQGHIIHHLIFFVVLCIYGGDMTQEEIVSRNEQSTFADKIYYKECLER